MRALARAGLVLVALPLVLAVLLAAVGVVGLRTIDPDQHKPLIERAIATFSGIDVHFGGHLAWTLWPRLMIAAEDVTIAADGTPLATFARLVIGAPAAPLLEGRLDLDALVAERYALDLHRRADGSANYDALAAALRRLLVHDDDQAALAVTMGGVQLRDGRVAWRDDGRGQAIDIDGINVTSGALALDQAIPLELGLHARAPGLKLDATITLKGALTHESASGRDVLAPLTARIALTGERLPGQATEVDITAALTFDHHAHRVSMDALSVRGLAVRADGTITVEQLDHAYPRVRGALRIDGDDLVVPLRAAGLDTASIAGLPNTARRFALAGDVDVDFDSGALAVPRFEARLLDAEAHGEVTARTDTPGNTSARAAFDARGPDLAALLGLVTQVAGADDALRTRLRQALAPLTERAFTLVAEMDLDLAAGTVRSRRLEARAFGNTVSGDLRLSHLERHWFEGRAGDWSKVGIEGQLRAEGSRLPAALAVFASLGGGPRVATLAQELTRSGAPPSFKFGTRFVGDAAHRQLVLDELHAQGGGMTASGHLVLDGFDIASGKGNVEGALDIASDKPAPWLRAAALPAAADRLAAFAVTLGYAGTMEALRLDAPTVALTIARDDRSPVKCALTADTARVNLRAGGFTVENLTLETLGLRAVSDITLEALHDTPRWRGRARIDEFSPRRLLERVGETVPVMRDKNVLNRAQLAAHVEGEGTHVTLNDLDVAFDDTRLAGMLEVRSLEDTSFAFHLTLDRLNADRYRAPDAGKPTIEDPAADAALADRVRGLTLNGDIAVADLTWADARFTDARFVFDTRGRRAPTQANGDAVPNTP